jgi:hypothetical protein
MVSTASLRATCALVLALLLPTSLYGQAGPTAAGTLLGTAGGAYLSLALTTAAARAGHYVYSPKQGIWRMTPIPVGAVAGGVLGYQGADHLRDATRLGLVGFAAGTAVGAAFGSLVWEGAEGIWSGAVIGGGVGLLAGSVWGALRAGGGPDEDERVLPAFTIAIPITP